MTNGAESYQPRGVSLELAHEMRRDKAIIDLQEQVRKLIMELEQVKGSERRVSRPREHDVNPIGIAYLSSHEDHKDRDNWVRGHPRDDLNDLKVEALKLNGNLKPKNYINCMEAIERII